MVLSSTAESHMSSYRAKMWRRIWWCIRLSIMSFRMSILILTQHLMDQIRDTLVSSSIGRPQHFSIYDCDVEMLTPQDLESEFQCGSEVMYSCQMARLCSICEFLAFSIQKGESFQLTDSKLVVLFPRDMQRSSPTTLRGRKFNSRMN